MASVYRDGDQWVADFRPVGGILKMRRKVRLKPKHLPEYTEAAALAFAKECDRYCRVLEAAPQRPEDIDHAERIRAITPEQAAELRAGLPVSAPVDTLRPLTLAEAARLHPSTQRDERTRPREAVLNLRHLDAFAAFAGVREVAAVDIGMALRWVAKLKGEGISWEGRRHRLLYLRRACRMAATRGLPDALAGLRIDHREDGDAPEVEAWTLDELARGASALTDDRARAALGLGGFVGLRPSECFRLVVGDLRGDLLDVGKRKAKNRSSRRTIPLPPTVARWCATIAAGRAGDAPLFGTLVRGRPGAFTEMSWAHWLKPLLAAATGRALKPKCLRKSFTSWAGAVIDGRDLERFSGHASAFLAPVSSAHYQADRAAAELRPAAALLERAIRAALGGVEKSAKPAAKRPKILHTVSTKSQSQLRQRA